MGSDGTVTILAYSGAVATPNAYLGDPANFENPVPSPSVTTTVSDCVVIRFWENTPGHDWTAPGGVTTRFQVTDNSVRGHRILAADEPKAVAGSTGAKSATPSGATQGVGWTVALEQSNTAPNAPILTAPAANAIIDRNSVQRFDWDFSDPDPGDSQSKYDLRYRLIGDAWTTVTDTTPTTFRDFAAATFADGDYEWQVLTYDAQGVAGSWSGSSFFTAADAPAAPTITAPTSGATVSSSETVTWSTPNQDAYQVQVLDGSTVVSDTGQVTSSTTRSITQEFPTNNVARTIQVRVRYGGLWSQWYTISVTVSFTPPETPVVTLAPDAATGSMTVSIVNPAPGAGVPATSYNDVYIDDGDGEERKATMLAPNTAWTYWTPRSGRDYDGSVSVTAVGDNGTAASS
jgi:hypothetical protein